jgi:hypothetical protein
MGTTNVGVKLVKTELAPLVRLAAFNRIVKDTDKVTRNFLGKKLFPGDFVKSETDRKDSSDTSGGDSGDQQGENSDDESVVPAVPQALTLLWALMHATKKDMDASLFQADNVEATATFLPWTDDTGFTTKDRARATGLIGTGAHGTVYGCSTDSTTCIKASRETRHIQRELKALKALNVTKCEQIPALLQVGQLKYNIRNVTAVVPAFVISPLGVSLRDCREEANIQKKMGHA